MTKFRKEKDSLGYVDVPNNKYWGAQTQRSLENFNIGSDIIPVELIHAFAIQKKASAISNLAIEKLDASIGEKIIQACDEIISGKLNEQFPLSVWQTGSGTQTNMNLNEVIANRANELLDKKKDSKRIHPNDHCNLGQSSNDSFPTAMHVSTILELNKVLFPAINLCLNALKKKETEFSKIIKIGRTHLQDATPITLGQEFSAFRVQIENSLSRIKIASNELYFLAQGGTAVGTGLNTSENFEKGFIKAIEQITNLPFKTSNNKFESLSSHDSLVNLSGAINSLLVASYKICNDIRLLSSGPRCGIGELILPSNEPGSSIMPGKINPTQCEALSQVCIYLMGYHFSITFAGSQGHFQLNANKTMIIYSTLRMIKLISGALNSFTKKCLIGIKANEKKIKTNLEQSLMLVTALNPRIGYDKCAEIAKKAYTENISLKEAAINLNYVSEGDFNAIVKPIEMTKKLSDK